MENAAAALNKLISKDPVSSQPETSRAPSESPAPNAAGVTEDVDESVDAEVAPAVEHTHVRKEHETVEQTFLEKEKHKDHYHTTIQPLKDSEVLPEKHDHIQETEERNVNLDDSKAKEKAKADLKGVKSTSEEKHFEGKTKEETQVDEHVHHHLHETIQPVIEKEVVVPSVTHKRIDVKENIQEPSEYHGVTKESAMSVKEFEDKLKKGKTDSVADGTSGAEN